MRQPASYEHVSPVKSKELDQLMESAQVAGCGKDECRLDTLGVLAAERIVCQAAKQADDLGRILGGEVVSDLVDQPPGWLCHESMVPNRDTVSNDRAMSASPATVRHGVWLPTMA